MKTVLILKFGNNQVVQLPKEMEFKGVNELEVVRNGSKLILRPIRPCWSTLPAAGTADDNFLIDREDVITGD